MRKFGVSFLVLGLAASFLLTGCGKTDNTDEEVVLLDRTEEDTTTKMTVVTKRDVVSSMSVRCAYTAVNVSDVSFDQEGQIISKVYVQEGDTVVKGQLLASLTTEGIDDQIKELDYQIGRTQIRLDQILADKQAAIERAELDYSYTNQWEKDQIEHKERLEAIDKEYQYSIEDCEDDLEMKQLQRSQLKKKLTSGNLYADLSGTVTYVKLRLEGASCVKGERIITITDSTECILTADRAEWREYFDNDAVYTMTVTTGSGAGDYDVMVYKPEETDGALRFYLTESNGSDVSIEVGTRGNILLVLDKRENVLAVTKSGVHSVDGKYYVYVLDEDGKRQTVFVEVGLYGNDYVEILSGLKEGDRVITE